MTKSCNFAIFSEKLHSPHIPRIPILFAAIQITVLNLLQSLPSVLSAGNSKNVSLYRARLTRQVYYADHTGDFAMRSAYPKGLNCIALHSLHSTVARLCARVLRIVVGTPSPHHNLSSDRVTALGCKGDRATPNPRTAKIGTPAA